MKETFAEVPLDEAVGLPSAVKNASFLLFFIAVKHREQVEVLKVRFIKLNKFESHQSCDVLTHAEVNFTLKYGEPLILNKRNRKFASNHPQIRNVSLIHNINEQIRLPWTTYLRVPETSLEIISMLSFSSFNKYTFPDSVR